MRDRLLFEVGGKLPAEKKEQAVANYVQRANIKKNAALAIKVMYKKILDILKKVWYYLYFPHKPCYRVVPNNHRFLYRSI